MRYRYRYVVVYVAITAAQWIECNIDLISESIIEHIRIPVLQSVCYLSVNHDKWWQSICAFAQMNKQMIATGGTMRQVRYASSITQTLGFSSLQHNINTKTHSWDENMTYIMNLPDIPANNWVTCFATIGFSCFRWCLFAGATWWGIS